MLCIPAYNPDYIYIYSHMSGLHVIISHYYIHKNAFKGIALIQTILSCSIQPAQVPHKLHFEPDAN